MQESGSTIPLLHAGGRELFEYGNCEMVIERTNEVGGD